MLDPKKSQMTEQSIAEIREVVPRMLKEFYDGCIEAGFTENPALFLTAELLKTIFGNAKNSGEKKDG